jgi:hypothetical protein
VKFYLYGIIDSSHPIQDVIYGQEYSGIYNIPYCDIGMVVSEMNRSIRIMTEKEVLIHEAVVERLMATFTVLPMRFQSVVECRDHVLLIMQSGYNDFRDNLEKLHNKIEFSIKVIWHADQIKEDIVRVLKDGTQKEPELNRSISTKYMTHRLEEYRRDILFNAQADELIRTVDRAIGKFATEKKLQKLRTASLVLDAVYLVEQSRKSSFVEMFRHIKSAHPELEFLLSGPWPAYNFIVLSRQFNPPRDFGQDGFLDQVAGSKILTGAAIV